MKWIASLKYNDHIISNNKHPQLFWTFKIIVGHTNYKWYGNLGTSEVKWRISILNRWLIQKRIKVPLIQIFYGLKIYGKYFKLIFAMNHIILQLTNLTQFIVYAHVAWERCCCWWCESCCCATTTTTTPDITNNTIVTSS